VRVLQLEADEWNVCSSQTTQPVHTHLLAPTAALVALLLTAATSARAVTTDRSSRCVIAATTTTTTTTTAPTLPLLRLSHRHLGLKNENRAGAKLSPFQKNPTLSLRRTVASD
jgi:hypothetical protein